jgi:hypothetical protein
MGYVYYQPTYGNRRLASTSSKLKIPILLLWVPCQVFHDYLPVANLIRSDIAYWLFNAPAGQCLAPQTFYGGLESAACGNLEIEILSVFVEAFLPIPTFADNERIAEAGSPVYADIPSAFVCF